jgi:hypothetical protein
MDNEDVTFSDFLPTIKDLGKGEWTTMYVSTGDAEGPAFYSALIREDQIEKALDDASWDILIGDGAPGLVTQYGNGDEMTWYSRPTDEGIEPFALSPLSEINSHGKIFMVPHCGISPLGEKE